MTANFTYDSKAGHFIDQLIPQHFLQPGEYSRDGSHMASDEGVSIINPDQYILTKCDASRSVLELYRVGSYIKKLYDKNYSLLQFHNYNRGEIRQYEIIDLVSSSGYKLTAQDIVGLANKHDVENIKFMNDLSLVIYETERLLELSEQQVISNTHLYFLPKLLRYVEGVRESLKLDVYLPSTQHDFYKKYYKVHSMPFIDNFQALEALGVVREVIYEHLPGVNDTEFELNRLFQLLSRSRGFNKLVFLDFTPSYKVLDLQKTSDSQFSAFQTLAKSYDLVWERRRAN